jgi:hypothetical protein
MRGADNLTTFMCRMSWKNGSLNLLEPSGPHRACDGTALPLPLFVCSVEGVIKSAQSYSENTEGERQFGEDA